jgi:penicillin-binding protein 2
MRRDTNRTNVFTRRALILGGIEALALGGLAAKLYQVQVVDGKRYALLAESNRVSARLLAPPRGRLLDRDGTPLAGNRMNWRAVLIAEQADDPQATLARFSGLIPLSEHERARIDRELAHSRRFIPIILRDFLEWDEMALIEVNAPDLPGVLIDVGTTRLYPFGATLAHVVGYVAPPSEDEAEDEPLLALPGMRVGRAAVEKYHDLALRGHAGLVQVEVNAVGRVIRELAREEGVPGAEITLTIDSGLQQDVVATLGDESASAVVLDARNGEVLAMATTPSFDPSLFNSGVSQAQWNEWTKNRQTPLINKAVAGLYAPGSTFKMVVAMAGLAARAITPNERIVCPGYLDLGDTRFHCWSRYGHGALDLRGGLKNSCDVFFYEVARRTGIDAIAAMANRFGLGVRPQIELPEARAGLVPTRAWRESHGHHWNPGDTVVHGIGQGFLEIAPVQLATMVARIATGRAIEPHLTRSINGAAAAGADPAFWPALDVPAPFLRAVREGMWAVVNEQGGTAPLARLDLSGMQLAGKTGSTQVRHVSREAREHGHFNSESLPWEFRPHALFVAFAPYDAPRYALAVVVEHGNAGAQRAAPLARAIMTNVLLRDPANRPPQPAAPRIAARLDPAPGTTPAATR